MKQPYYRCSVPAKRCFQYCRQVTDRLGSLGQQLKGGFDAVLFLIDDDVAQDCVNGVRPVKVERLMAVGGTTDDVVAFAFQPAGQVHGRNRRIFNQQ